MKQHSFMKAGKYFIFTGAFLVSALLCSCSGRNWYGGHSASEETVRTGDRSNAALENIFSRKSVRVYSDKVVSDQDLELIARAAMAAPSARDRRPWHIIAVNSPKLIEELSAANKQIGRARALLIICGDKDRFMSGEGELFWAEDCAAASQNALLAAESLGLGAVWLGVFPVPDRVKALALAAKLPENLVPFSVISIGYPAGKNYPKNKFDAKRFELRK